MAITGLVTGGATALGLAALTVSLHLPTNAYKQERARRLSEPQSAGTMSATKAREAVLERMTSREEGRGGGGSSAMAEKEKERRGSVVERELERERERRGSVVERARRGSVTEAVASANAMPPGRRFSFGVGGPK